MPHSPKIPPAVNLPPGVIVDLQQLRRMSIIPAEILRRLIRLRIMCGPSAGDLAALIQSGPPLGEPPATPCSDCPAERQIRAITDFFEAGGEEGREAAKRWWCHARGESTRCVGMHNRFRRSR